VLAPAIIGLLVLGVVSLAVLASTPGRADPTPSRLSATATTWVGAGRAQEPRRDRDEWEVDVLRPDGSLVEVTLGRDYELLALDEELRPGGRPAPDELTGPLRARAVAAALAVTGHGKPLSAERESPRIIEIGIRHGDGERVEIALDQRFRVVEAEREHPGDE
jgi:hypothetical protein